MPNVPLARPDRLTKPERRPYLSVILTLLPLISSVMLWVALNNLGMTGEGVPGFIKTLLLPVAAYMVSYATYRMAIEKSATLVSVGFNAAAFVGLISILIVGAGMFMATMPGLIIRQVEERRLQAYVSETEHYVNVRSAAAAQSGRLVPVVTAIAADLAANAACEKQSSCVSLSGGGGYGPAARTLDTLAARAASVRDAIAGGLQQRDNGQAALAAQMAQMETVLADEGTDIWKRRTALRKRDGEIDPLLSGLDEAVPASTLAAYAGELRGGVTLPGQPVATKRIEALLAGYAGNIEAVLGDIGADSVTRPVFPARSGAIQTFAYIGDFAPVAVLTFAVELLFPLTLWAYTVMSLIWARHQDNPEAPAPRDSPFEDLTNLRAIAIPKQDPPRPAATTARRKPGPRRRQAED
ncbi:hypothetical protein FJU08_00690 [Martelella alba]|uniref:Uncharacterized protein n=1 Tax=Martelella alba TaxID=2590451 RepID=A0A506UII1_9HYPH|nr:hypothetical protein [Martelella alba]TPW33119.1 hypothetical protein FJU08_00690 [Martelella alba]